MRVCVWSMCRAERAKEHTKEGIRELKEHTKEGIRELKDGIKSLFKKNKQGKPPGEVKERPVLACNLPPSENCLTPPSDPD